jgi:hypothetical protein
MLDTRSACTVISNMPVAAYMYLYAGVQVVLLLSRCVHVRDAELLGPYWYRATRIPRALHVNEILLHHEPRTTGRTGICAKSIVVAPFTRRRTVHHRVGRNVDCRKAHSGNRDRKKKHSRCGMRKQVTASKGSNKRRLSVAEPQ